MNTPQHNPEASIDRALASLRHAQPREGIERRILHALESGEARTASPHQARTPRQLIPSLPLAVCITAGALALLTVAALHLLHTHPRPQTLALTTPVPMPTSVSPSEPQSAASSPHQAGWPTLSHSSRKGEVAMPAPRTVLSSRLTSNLSSRPKAALFAAVAERPTGRITASSTAPQLTPEEAADLADLHAPSHPAPPLPLTAQEKALLSLLHRGNAVELADLIPAVSAAHDAEEAAAFHTFFPDPPPIQQPTGDTE